MDLCGSEFTNKYAEGYPGKRYYNGCGPSDEIETLAIESLCELFNCSYANVQPHSGANANTAVYQALLRPGSKILGMDLASGGHLSHGARVNLSGKVYTSFAYGVDEQGFLDYDDIERIAGLVKPDLIVAGASAYPRQIDWKRFREIADSVGAYLLADCSHYSGLIAGGAYPSPIKYADVTTTTTHKTLRGPRGGAIMWNNDEYTRKINSAIFPGTQGGPLMHIIAAKAQCFIEAQDPSFTVYAFDITANARAMCNVFKLRGIKMQTQGTDSHIILIDLSDENVTGRQLADELEKHNITVNKNGVPNDPRSFVETSGIRIGTAAETTRGHSIEWFQDLANSIADVIQQFKGA
jgi:glycine hydroxymethyltransferase